MLKAADSDLEKIPVVIKKKKLIRTSFWFKKKGLRTYIDTRYYAFDIYI